MADIIQFPCNPEESFPDLELIAFVFDELEDFLEIRGALEGDTLDSMLKDFIKYIDASK